MLLVGGNHATARPLRIHAEAHHSDWSFVYGGPGDRTREASLYLPKDRRVILRIGRRRPGRVIRMDPLHLGDMSIPCGSGRAAISADVLGPKRFRSQLDRVESPRPDRGARPS
jgi:hypothetical protein